MKGMLSIVLCCALVVGLGATAVAEKITVAGSSTVKPIMAKATEAFTAKHPEVTFVVGGGGSGKGVSLSGTGAVMIGMASRNMKDKEKATYPELVPVKVGLDGIAIIVNKSNPVAKLTKEQICDIYTGQIKSWKDLGGDDAAIKLTAMGTNHGTHDMFLKYFGCQAKMNGAKTMVHAKKGGEDWSSVSARSVESSKEGLAAVMTDKNAVAYVSIGAAQKIVERGGPVKLIELDGVAATTENVASGTYPLCRNLLVLTKGTPTGNVKAFIDFLTGPDGQKIVEQLDYIPAR